MSIYTPTRECGAVVVPTGHDPASFTTVRSLGRQGVTTIVGSEHRTVPAAASRYCDEFVDLPSPYEDLVAYKDALVDLAKRPEVRTIVPIRPHDTYVLSRYAEEFAPYVSLPVPDPATLERVHDRVQLAAAATDAGVPFPETCTLDEFEPDPDRGSIVKSRFNLLADGYLPEYEPGESAVVKTVQHLAPGESPDRDALTAEMGHVPIVQSFVPTAEKLMFAALYDHGRAVATFQHRQIRGNSYTGGGGVYRQSMFLPDLERVARRLLDHLEWHGLACIEYIRDAETGEYKPIEINPRMWQSLPSTVQAGADFPFYYWQQATGRADEIDAGYELGLGSHQLYGELDHLLSVLRDDSPLVDRPVFSERAREVLASCLAEPKFDYLKLDDPRPFLRGLRQVFG
ncbi:carboxylate--amine ligase [Halorarius litoreus]|uniref:carboxylate--amine ligase n=1 Tax=Halorarius litoreus TaxID=2962676 RepID=UPI0020CFDB28|nr:carboxylate--amine ligase [Halorarius litoreus]